MPLNDDPITLLPPVFTDGAVFAAFRVQRGALPQLLSARFYVKRSARLERASSEQMWAQLSPGGHHQLTAISESASVWCRRCQDLWVSPQYRRWTLISDDGRRWEIHFFSKCLITARSSCSLRRGDPMSSRRPLNLATWGDNWTFEYSILYKCMLYVDCILG